MVTLNCHLSTIWEGRDCLGQGGLWTCLWNIFWIVNWSGKTRLLWVSPFPRKRGLNCKSSESELTTGIHTWILHFMFLVMDTVCTHCRGSSQGWTWKWNSLLSCFLFFFLFFSFFPLLTWVFLIYISNVIPFPGFLANIPLTPPPPILYRCSPPHPPPITTLPPTITFTGIHLGLCCILAVSLRSDLHPAPVGLHFFASSILSNWMTVYARATCGAGSEWVFLLSLF